MKIENWNGHDIRFVEVDGEWWAVLVDITKALNVNNRDVRRRLTDEVVSTHLIQDTLGRKQEMLIVNEYGIYETVFESRKKEAKEFKRWVFTMIKTLRQQTGLEGFQVFRMLDKEHQKVAMSRIQQMKQPDKKTYIKANTIANKAISNKYGFPKMVKKEKMTPQMMLDRQPILDDTVNLIRTKDDFNLDISISDSIYRKWN